MKVATGVPYLTHCPRYFAGQSLLAFINRVLMPPRKSQNCVFKISRIWKVLENEFGPGNLSSRSWKVLEFARQ